ncbi:MAG: sigma-70 family RNA polymerase sigma factor [Kofleriaceae bacterium]
MNVDELMTEMTWLRRLARGLVDPDAADDIAQDAYLVASEHAPTDGRPLRPWLHRVVTNLVRMRHRSTTRREARERNGSTAVATPAELVEQVEIQRALADEVLALREPYRSTILLHYVEGLSSAEIARQLGIPSATVRQRLKHALGELRDRLERRDHAPNRGWMIALAQVKPPLAVGALVMKKWLIAIVVMVLLLLGGGVVWRLIRTPADDETTATTAGGGSGTKTDRRLAATIAGRPVDVPAWIALPNAPRRQLAGRVLANAAPVAGAIVRLGIMASNPRIGTPAMTAGPPFVQVAQRESDREGNFDFGMVVPANFVISAEAEGHAPVSIGVQAGNPKANPAPEHVVLVLGDCRSRVTGIVRDSVNPIPHARLLIAGLAGGESDAKGAFNVCMPDTQYPNIRVDADGYGSINVQVPAMAGVIRRDFLLVPEATISGVVVDEAGEPVPAAVVAARPALADQQDEASGIDTIADAQGRFQLSRLAPTKYGLGAFSAGGQSDHPVVVAVAGVATRDVKLVIQRRAVLRGHVMRAGMPVAGAFVGTEKSPFARFSKHYAESQADGSFVLDGVALGQVELSAYPYEVVSPKSLDLKTLAGTDVVIEVSELSSIRGKVTRHGVAVPNARVSVVPLGDAAIADAGGLYELRGLPPGTYTLTASTSRAFTNHPMTLGASERQTVDLELEGGGQVLGTVVDEAGAPVAGVMVSLDSTDNSDSCGAFTDDRGRFDCAALAGHLDYQPQVFPTVARQRSFRNASGTKLPLIHVDDGDAVVRDVRLVIEHELLAIRGRVVDETGAVIADARVSVPNQDWGDAARTRADEGGGFILENLAPQARYDLRARTSDGSTGVVYDVKAGTANVEIKLVRPGAITGTLAGFTGAVNVLASKALFGEEDVYEAKIDGDHFSITGLQPGNYTVQARRAGTQLDGTTVDVKSGVTATVSFRNRQRATIDGRVADLASGAPLAGMACRASLSLGGREGPNVGTEISSQLTGPTGTFSVDAPIGRVRVTCLFMGGAHSHAGGDFDIVAGANRVELTSVANVVPDGVVGFILERNVIPATVMRVVPRTAALGVQVGDQVVGVDGVDTRNMISDAVTMLITSKGPGPTVTLQLLRGTQRVIAKVPLVPDN